MSDRISLVQGAGGDAMQKLLKEVILKHLADGSGEVGLGELDDSGVIDDMVFTIDGHTVQPLEYPGGNIGRLAVSGTINDLCAMGASPMALASGLVVEEGLSSALLDRIMESMGRTAREAGVPIITGDTKVVERGGVREMNVTTAGLGRAGESLQSNRRKCLEAGRDIRWLCDRNPRPGDKLIITGTIGDHGIALLSFREGYGFETSLESDNAPLNHLMEKALMAGGVVAAKDPTRGGVANALNEWSEKSGMGLEIDEASLPFKEAVLGASELLGIDPLNIGNEGKMLLAVLPEMAEKVLEAVKKDPCGRDAAIIGEAKEDLRGVVLRTKVGGRRIMEPPIGDPVPRIC
ncbi:MAG: hydrogenase expression/formation protein HypE [Candidatus Thermoplasmatota archaeon]|nr:hydrogenase expression/formation protein HypE [Candidatus Thermoplasmatota archaeon]